MTTPRKQRIRLKPRHTRDGVKVGGWLTGRNTFLWLGDGKGCISFIDGYGLYRLAKAIVRHWEADLESR